jgi:DNA-binding NarL/FixJ family response regulator
VRRDRPWGDPQDLGDVAIRPPLGDERQDLTLSRGDTVEERDSSSGLDRRKRIASSDAPDGPDEVAHGRLSRHSSDGPCPERPPESFLIFLVGEDQDACRRQPFRQPLDGLLLARGQPEIQEGDVGLGDHVQSLSDGSRPAEERQIRRPLADLSKSVSYDRVIIDHQQLDQLVSLDRKQSIIHPVLASPSDGRDMVRGERIETGREVMKVGVLLVDDHPVVRYLVRSICEEIPGFEVLGESDTGPRALHDFHRLSPSMVVLDLMLPGLDGLELARRLRRSSSAPKILVLSRREDPDALLEAMAAGVDGYLPKTASAQVIREALRTIADGGRVFTMEQESAAASRLGSRARLAAEASRMIESLTPRQRQILEMIARGATASEMAAQAEISERSVRSHITALYRKLGVRNRVEAVGRAVLFGLLREEGAERQLD